MCSSLLACPKRRTVDSFAAQCHLRALSRVLKLGPRNATGNAAANLQPTVSWPPRPLFSKLVRFFVRRRPKMWSQFWVRPPGPKSGPLSFNRKEQSPKSGPLFGPGTGPQIEPFRGQKTISFLFFCVCFWSRGQFSHSEVAVGGGVSGAFSRPSFRTPGMRQ